MAQSNVRIGPTAYGGIADCGSRFRLTRPPAAGESS